jgi:hypothetical protein
MNKETVKSPVKFGPREYAIFNQVWSLSKQERDMLDSCFILRSTIDVVMKRAWLKNYGSYLTYRGINYLLIDNQPNFSSYNNVLLSLRYSAANNYAVAMMKTINKPLSQHALETFSELE